MSNETNENNGENETSISIGKVILVGLLIALAILLLQALGNQNSQPQVAEVQPSISTEETAGVALEVSGACQNAVRLNDSDGQTTITATADQVLSVEAWGDVFTEQVFVIVPAGESVERTWQGGAVWAYSCTNVQAVLSDLANRGREVYVVENGALPTQAVSFQSVATATDAGVGGGEVVATEEALLAAQNADSNIVAPCPADRDGDSDGLASITSPEGKTTLVEAWGGDLQGLIVIPAGETIVRTWTGGAKWLYPCNVETAMVDIMGKHRDIYLVTGGVATLFLTASQTVVDGVGGGSVPEGVCPTAEQLDPWPPNDRGEGGNFEVTAHRNWVHASLWWPQTTSAPWGIGEVSVLIPQGTSIEVQRGAGTGWDYAEECSDAQVMAQVNEYRQNRRFDTDFHGAVELDQLVELGLVVIRFQRDPATPTPDAGTPVPQVAAGECADATEVGLSDEMTTVSAPANAIYVVEAWGAELGDALVIIPSGESVRKNWQGGKIWSYGGCSLDSVMADLQERTVPIYVVTDGELVAG